MGSAVAVGIVLPSNDPTLTSILVGSGSGGGTAAASPYVIAMQNLGVGEAVIYSQSEGKLTFCPQIGIFPHIVNALLISSIFSAGNSYVYCTSRSLYSMAIEGRAPAIFKKCTKQGVPIYCLALTMAFACLSFLQQGEKTSRALGILINLVSLTNILSQSAIVELEEVLMFGIGHWRSVRQLFGHVSDLCLLLSRNQSTGHRP